MWSCDAQDEMETMLKTQEDLKQGNQKLNSMLSEMEAKKVWPSAWFHIYFGKGPSVSYLVKGLQFHMRQSQVENISVGEL